MVFLKQMLENIGLRKIIDENVDLPKAKSNRVIKHQPFWNVLLPVFGAEQIDFYIL